MTNHSDTTKPKKKPDGGRVALAGFLYQIIGTLSLTPTVLKNLDDPDTIDILYQLRGVGNAIKAKPEYLGQDAAFINENDDVVLVQFKCSMINTPIDKSELEKIVKKLEDSAKEAEAKGYTVTACVLITNRQFRNSAKNWWDDKVKTLKQDTSCNYNLRCYSDALLEKFEIQLNEFGKQYGAFDNEIEKGINELLGKVLRQSAGPRNDTPITIEDFKKAFTGCRNARPLTPDNVSVFSNTQFANHLGRIGLKGEPVHRDILYDLNQACLENALIILHGEGGDGKTVALWQWANTKGAFKLFSPINKLKPNWITNEICKWQKLSNCNDSIDDSIKRLCIANPTQPKPLLYVALDGLDEQDIIQSSKTDYIEYLIEWFWNEDINARKKGCVPRAVLVITCSNSQYEKGMRE